MKEKKTNIRSFRYSDRVAEILESSEGNTLNEKFENLVLFCFDELPKVKRDLDMYQNLIKEEKDKYFGLKGINREFVEITYDLMQAKKKLDKMVGREEDV